MDKYRPHAFCGFEVDLTYFLFRTCTQMIVVMLPLKEHILLKICIPEKEHYLYPIGCSFIGIVPQTVRSKCTEFGKPRLAPVVEWSLYSGPPPVSIALFPDGTRNISPLGSLISSSFIIKGKGYVEWK